MKKVDFVSILIRLASFYLLVKHIDGIIDVISFSSMMFRQDTFFDQFTLIIILVTKLIYFGFLIFVIYYSAQIASRIVPEAESTIDLSGFSKLDISLLGIFIVAGYTFLDGLSDLIVEVYYYMQKKLSNSYDQIILFNPKLFLSSLLKTILGYVVLFYHKTIYKYINDWDQNINHK